jgi:hypothetical protein
MSLIKPFKIPSAIISSLSLLEDKSCQRIKSNGSTLHLVCGQCWFGLLLVRTIGVQYEIIVKYFKAPFDIFFPELFFVHAIYEK